MSQKGKLPEPNLDGKMWTLNTTVTTRVWENTPAEEQNCCARILGVQPFLKKCRSYQGPEVLF